MWCVFDNEGIMLLLEITAFPLFFQVAFVFAFDSVFICAYVGWPLYATTKEACAVMESRETSSSTFCERRTMFQNSSFVAQNYGALVVIFCEYVPWKKSLAYVGLTVNSSCCKSCKRAPWSECSCLLQAFEESVNWSLLSWLCLDSDLHTSVFK